MWLCISSDSRAGKIFPIFVPVKQATSWAEPFLPLRLYFEQAWQRFIRWRYIHKYQCPGPSNFRQEDFYSIPYMSMQNKWPLGRGHFLPQGYNLNNLGRGPQDKGTFQIKKKKNSDQRPRPLNFRLEDFQSFLFFFDFGFTALSRIFHLYQADHSSKVGENRRTRRKTTWPPVSRTWLSHIWPERGSNHSGEKPNRLRVNSLIH